MMNNQDTHAGGAAGSGKAAAHDRAFKELRQLTPQEFDIRIAADWALAQGNAPALADILARGRAMGASFDVDDPFSLSPLLNSLAALDGGRVLADALLAEASRGQLGGAPRRDFVLEPGASQSISFTLVNGERAFIEARLKRGSDGADIDLTLLDADAAKVAEDAGPETGVTDIGALIIHVPTACEDVTIVVTNRGDAAGDVALLVPLSPKQSCEG